MLPLEMSLDFEEEVVLGLVGYHVWCPSVTVGFPSFVLPFDSTEANFGGGFTDVLEVLFFVVGKNQFNLA